MPGDFRPGRSSSDRSVQSSSDSNPAYRSAGVSAARSPRVTCGSSRAPISTVRRRPRPAAAAAPSRSAASRTTTAAVIGLLHDRAGNRMEQSGLLRRNLHRRLGGRSACPHGQARPGRRRARVRDRRSATFGRVPGQGRGTSRRGEPNPPASNSRPPVADARLDQRLAIRSGTGRDRVDDHVGALRGGDRPRERALRAEIVPIGQEDEDPRPIRHLLQARDRQTDSVVESGPGLRCPEPTTRAPARRRTPALRARSAPGLRGRTPPGRRFLRCVPRETRRPHASPRGAAGRTSTTSCRRQGRSPAPSRDRAPRRSRPDGRPRRARASSPAGRPPSAGRGGTRRARRRGSSHAPAAPAAVGTARATSETNARSARLMPR